MKILYVIDGMFNSAGMERTVSNKATYLTQLDYEVSILTTNQRNRNYYYEIPDSVHKFDLRINFDSYIKYNILFRIIIYFFKSIIFKVRLRIFFNNNNYDIIVCLMPRALNPLIKSCKGSKIIFEHHFSFYFNEQFDNAFNRNQLSKYIYKYRFNRLCKNLRLIDHFVVLTHEDMEYWSNHYPFNNLKCIPNSIDYDIAKVALLSSKTIITVGRLDFQKGFDRLILIWKEISDVFSDWELHIYGDGPDKEKLNCLISTLNLQNSLKIFPPTKDIEKRLMESSIYVLPSRFEGLPMVLLEAMSVGLPVVAFACKCGPKDIINDSVNGYLCNQDDIEDFSTKLKYLMSSYDLRQVIGHNAKLRASEFSHYNISKIWNQLFKEI